MSLRINLLSNYFAKIYTALLAVVVVPFYLRLLGLEAYGVVGFYISLMALMQLLDVGLSSTLARQVALMSVGKTDAQLVQYTLKIVFIGFLGVGFVVATFFWFSASSLAGVWFNTESLSPEVLQVAIVTIGFTLATRCIGGPLRSILVGSEKLVILNVIVVLVASLRYLLVIPILGYFSSGEFHALVVFFYFQLFVAALECLALLVCAHRCVRFFPTIKPNYFFKNAKPIFMFALAAAASSWMWVAIMQLDKLALSKWLPLKIFGAFSAAMAIAAGVQMLSAPLVQAIMPRLAKLYGAGDKVEYLIFFDECITKYAIYFSPLPCFIALFSKEILVAWTANSYVVEYAALPLSLYTLAFWIVSIASFYYYLQHSSGQLRLHNRILLCMLLYTLTIVVAAAYFAGAMGTGIAWLVMALAYLLFGGYVVMRKFHLFNIIRWLSLMVIPYSLVALVLNIIAYLLFREGVVTGLKFWIVPIDLCVYFIFCTLLSIIIGRKLERILKPSLKEYGLGVRV